MKVSCMGNRENLGQGFSSGLARNLEHVNVFDSKYVASGLGDLLALVLPILGVFVFNLIGDLRLHELLLVLACPILVRRRGFWLRDSNIRQLGVLLGLWFMSQIVTDLIRQTPINDVLRGWAKIFTFASCFVSIYLLLTTYRRVFYFLVGSSCLIFFHYLFFNNWGYNFNTAWKMGLGEATFRLVALGIMFLHFSKLRRSIAFYLCALFLLCFSVFSFLVNSRSLAGSLFLSFIFVLATNICSERKISVQRFFRSPVKFFLVLMALVIMTLYIYQAGAESGAFGFEAQKKFQMQKIDDLGLFGVLLGGRSEIFASGLAIYDSPFIGHGSWAKNPRYSELAHFLRLKYDPDSKAPQADANEGLIPTHSYLFGAWVEGGVLGALFWLFVLQLLFRAFSLAWGSNNVLSLFILVTFTGNVWSVFFSPFGGGAKVAAATTIFLCVYFIRAHEKRRVDQFGNYALRAIPLMNSMESVPPKSAFHRFHIKFAEIANQ